MFSQPLNIQNIVLSFQKNILTKSMIGRKNIIKLLFYQNLTRKIEFSYVLIHFY